MEVQNYECKNEGIGKKQQQNDNSMPGNNTNSICGLF